MKQKNYGTKLNLGIVGGVLSLILGGGSVIGFLVFLIVAVFAAIGLSTYQEGTEAWIKQNAVVQNYEFLAYLFAALAVVFVVLGIVLLVVFIKKKKNLKKQAINTEEK